VHLCESSEGDADASCERVQRGVDLDGRGLARGVDVHGEGGGSGERWMRRAGRGEEAQWEGGSGRSTLAVAGGRG